MCDMRRYPTNPKLVLPHPSDKLGSPYPAFGVGKLMQLSGVEYIQMSIEEAVRVRVRVSVRITLSGSVSVSVSCRLYWMMRVYYT